MGKKFPQIGARLRQLRVDAGLTQPELAARAGLHLGTMTKIEYGDNQDPQLSTLYALAGALGLSVAELLGPLVQNKAPAPPPDPIPGTRPRRGRGDKRRGGRRGGGS